jgi:ribonuclease HI
MSSPNTALWDNLGRTDPKHTKQFKRGGGFKGTAIKPMWSFRRMTEEFGPCGIGWGVGEPSFQVVNGDNREVLVYCIVKVWFKQDDNHSQHIYGVGGDKVVTYIKESKEYNRPERWESDDEAFKKAFTDAVTNALKLIGVGADVHMGLFDDSKYVREMAEEFTDEPVKPAKSSAALKRDDAWQEFTDDLRDIRSLAALEQCKDEWRKKVIADGWNRTWIAAMPDEFAAVEKRIREADEFPGNRPPLPTHLANSPQRPL